MLAILWRHATLGTQAQFMGSQERWYCAMRKKTTASILIQIFLIFIGKHSLNEALNKWKLFLPRPRMGLASRDYGKKTSGGMLRNVLSVTDFSSFRSAERRKRKMKTEIKKYCRAVLCCSFGPQSIIALPFASVNIVTLHIINGSLLSYRAGCCYNHYELHKIAACSYRSSKLIFENGDVSSVLQQARHSKPKSSPNISPDCPPKRF